MSTVTPIRLVLFDLDGTLFDSAPDLVAAANRLRTRRNQLALPFDTVRPHAGRGARGLIGITMNVTPEDCAYPDLQREFLDDYQSHCCESSHLFCGVNTLLSSLTNMGLAWGIVTNKHARFTEPITQAFNLDKDACVIVSGDATGRLKPAPDNLLLALKKAGYQAQETLYVGDDLRDAQAARAAGMRFAAAAYGYLGLTSDVSTWDADYVLQTPETLIDILKEKN